MAPHSSTLAWKIPWMEKPGRGLAKSQTRLRDFTFTFHFSLSLIGDGNGNPLQCSCLENPRDGGAWWAAVHGVTQSQPRLKPLSSSSSVCVCVSYPVVSDSENPGYSVHGILWARTPQWVAIPFSRGSSQTQGSSLVFLPCRQILYFLSHQGSPRGRRKIP